MKRALITGITGQDGSYLTEFLLDKGYEVHGLVRRSSTFGTERNDHLYVDPHLANTHLFLHYADLADGTTLSRLLQTIQPTEIYNLGAQSHVGVSFSTPIYTADVVALGTLRLLEAPRQLDPPVRFDQASSSEMYGQVAETPQSEAPPFHPRSPYGVAKVYAYWQTINYREAYTMFACNGILFNHESPVRGETFVTRKITRAAARIHLGLQKKVFLGNLDAERDWGHAKDYVEGMYLMLQQKEAEDFVLATGKKISVRKFIALAFAETGTKIEWKGKHENEKGINSSSGKTIIEIDKKYFRPTEVDLLIGDATKAKKNLNWQPEYTVEDLVKEMVASDLKIFERDKYLLEGGHRILNQHE